MSEAVFTIMQIGKQADTTTAAAAKVLLPVDAGAVIDEDRSPVSPDEDYGENTANQPGRGTYGTRGASLSVTGEVRAEDFLEILSMHGKGGVTPTGGASAYVWAFPWDLTSDTRQRMTIECGTVGDVKDQWRAVGCQVDSLEFGFDALTAPGNAPWKFTADIQALYREQSNLTAGLSPYSPIETFEGHMTDLYEGPVATAYDSLVNAAASLKSFKITSNLNLVRRIYGGTVDYASAWGVSARKAVSFTAELGINTTTKAGVHDVYATAGALMMERRWRILARGSRLTTQSEVQVLTMSTAGGAATGGTFTLTFAGATTPALPYNETNANVQIALRALPTINGANVGVSGSAGGPYTVTFAGTLANLPQLLIQANTALVTGPGSPYTMTIARTVPGGQLKTLTIDGRVRFHVVNIGDVDGEHIYTVEGVYVKDPVANSGTGTDLKVSLLNGVATQLSV